MSQGGTEFNSTNGLVQDCSNSSANALELLQSCTKSWYHVFVPRLCLSHVATMSSAEESMETDTTVAETVVSPNDVSTAVPTYPYNLFSHKPNRVSIPESCSQQEKKEICKYTCTCTFIVDL